MKKEFQIIWQDDRLVWYDEDGHTGIWCSCGVWRGDVRDRRDVRDWNLDIDEQWYDGSWY